MSLRSVDFLRAWRIVFTGDSQELERPGGSRNIHVALGPLSDQGFAELTVYWLPEGKKTLESVVVDYIP